MTNPDPTQDSRLSAEGLIAQYIKLRDKKARMKAEYEAAASEITELQNKIEALLLHRMSEMGAESVKTPAGTAYVVVRTAANLGDWDSFKGFLDKQEDPFMFVERRVSKAAVEQYREAHGEIPPGLNWSETRVVNFRR